MTHSGPQVLFKTCIAMKFVDDDDDDDDDESCALMAGGTLYYRKSGRTQKVITSKEERDSVLESAHLGSEEDKSSSHADSAAMLAVIEPRYKWSDTRLDIDDWVMYLCCFDIVLAGK